MNRTMRAALVVGLVAMLVVAGSWAIGARHDTGTGAPDLYVALGASDSVGVGADVPEREGWVPRVHATLPPGTRLVNLGVSGATTAEIAAQQLPPALDTRPRLVTLWCGVNDLARQVPLPTFSAQLDDLLGQLRAAAGPQATIVVLNLPNLHYVPVFSRFDAAFVDQTITSWNGAIAEVAQKHDVVLVDLYTEWPELADHPEYISADGFHPSTVGYERIAALVVAAIERHAAARS